MSNSSLYSLLFLVDVRSGDVFAGGVGAAHGGGHGLAVAGNPGTDGVDDFAATAEAGYALVRARAFRRNGLPAS